MHRSCLFSAGYYTDVQKDDDRADNGKMCNGEDCLLDSYAIGCTYGETASAFVNISNDRRCVRCSTKPSLPHRAHIL